MPQTQKQPAFQKRVQVRITLENGDLAIDTDPAYVEAGGAVHWELDRSGPLKWFALLMKGDTPFGDGHGWSGEARGSTAIKRIDSGAHRGETTGHSYPYAVVASDGETVYFRDPEVVVGPVDGKP